MPPARSSFLSMSLPIFLDLVIYSRICLYYCTVLIPSVTPNLRRLHRKKIGYTYSSLLTYSPMVLHIPASTYGPLSALKQTGAERDN